MSRMKKSRKSHDGGAHESRSNSNPTSAAHMGKTPASLYTHKVIPTNDPNNPWRRVPRTDVQIAQTRNNKPYYAFGRVGLSDPDHSANQGPNL